ncbi:hypothetical protein OF83DRAFT_1089840, partial [Amylostereum chailletii]
MDSIIEFFSKEQYDEREPSTLLSMLLTLDLSTCGGIVVQKDVDGAVSAHTQNEGGLEEGVYVVHGLVAALDLPPITHKSQLMPKPAWAKQSISIVGLGTPSFDKALSTVYRPGCFEDWSPSHYGPFFALEFSNCYVTRISSVRGQPAIFFTQQVDPNGVMADILSSAGIHLDDNRVQYFCRDPTSEDGFVAEDPALFRIGQIVELQVSFTSVPLWGRKGMFRMATKLRAIAILDTYLQQ